jgi:transposase
MPRCRPESLSWSVAWARTPPIPPTHRPLTGPASELVADARQLERRIAAVEARIKTAVAQSRTSLLELFGVGPVLAATFLGEVGDIGRFPTKHHFAAHRHRPAGGLQRPGHPATGYHGPGTASSTTPCT